MSRRGVKVFAFEVPGGSQSQRAAACLGMAKGVIASILAQQLFEDITPGSWMRAPVMPNDVHKRVTGKTKATKEDVMNYVLENYSNQITFMNKKYGVYHHVENDASVVIRYTKGQFEHIADAIVIAECGFKQLEETK